MPPFLGSAYHALTGRSSKWPAVRKAFLAVHPYCAVCGTGADLEVHHKIPYHLRPEKELDPDNLMTLCRPHHLLFGHLMLWKSWNIHVEADAATWDEKIGDRPLPPVGAVVPSRWLDRVLGWLGF